MWVKLPACQWTPRPICREVTQARARVKHRRAFSRFSANRFSHHPRQQSARLPGNLAFQFQCQKFWRDLCCGHGQIAQKLILGRRGWGQAGRGSGCADRPSPARGGARGVGSGKGSSTMSGVATSAVCPPTASITSAAPRTSVAPSRISMLHPAARASNGWPGTANTSRP